MADSYLVTPKKQPKNKTDQKNNRIVSLMYFAGPTSVVPDIYGRSDVIGKDCVGRPTFQWHVQQI